MIRLASIAFLLLTLAPSLRAETGDLVFVAYNLKNYLDMDRRVGGEFLENAPKPANEIAALIAILKPVRPDILGVCEIGDADDVADLVARLKEAGLSYPHIEHVRAADEARTLAILSRFPIVDTHHQTALTYLIDNASFPVQRGILDVTVAVNGDYRLRLLGLHLKSKRPVPEADQALMRRNEAHLLREHIDRILDDNPATNLLVYGDFNDTKNELPIKAIKGKFGTADYLRDIWVADADGHRWTYYWSEADQYSRFDFVFVNEAFFPEIELGKCRIATGKDWFLASDHRPVVIAFRPEDR